MKIPFATACFVLGALLAPVAGYSADPMSKEGAKEFVKDTEITAKVKTAFAKDKQVSALHIRVDTDNSGAVVLSGVAKSPAEAEKAESLARSVKGVETVQNKIEVKSDR